MSIIDAALSANATIANDFDPHRGEPPAPKIAIVTCADPRLSNIEQMLGLAEGDVDMIRNFGTVIDDDAIRSLVLSTRLLGTREIMIINHTDCGMLRFTDGEMEDRLRMETGQTPIAPARFYSFTDVETNTREQMQKARSHPWISPEVPVRGFVYDVKTGRLSEVFPDGEQPADRMVVTHFIVSADVERSRRFYTEVLGGTVVFGPEPTNIALANSFIIINVGGGPTDDKPTVTLETPRDPDRVSSFLNLRVADIHAVYAEWSARGAQFLTPPKQHKYEIRCYIRDPDGYIIEVGQTTDPQGDWWPADWPPISPQRL
jgi:carbonic anhydrase